MTEAVYIIIGLCYAQILYMKQTISDFGLSFYTDAGSNEPSFSLSIHI